MSVYTLTNTAFTTDAPFGPSLTGLVGTISVEILDSAGNIITAPTTAGIIESPAGSGDYVKTFSSGLASLGDYRAFWSTNGSPPQEAVDDIHVVAVLPTTSLTTPSGIDLCTLADVRAALRIESGFTDWDTQISAAITMASARIVTRADREFAPISVALKRRFVSDRTPGALIHFGAYDLQPTPTPTVTLNPEASSPVTLTSPADYVLEPIQSRSGTYKQLRLTPSAPIFSTVSVRYGYAYLDITGTWGFPSVPPDIRSACIETVRSWLDTAVQAYGARDLIELPRDTSPIPFGTYDLPPGALRAVRDWADWTP